MLPVSAADEWVIVRGIAYSGLPGWKELLRKYSDRLPTRQIMIAEYLAGRSPTLGALTITQSPTHLAARAQAFAIDWPGSKKDEKPPVLEPSQIVLDTLWGYYLASGSYGPLLRMVELLPWSKDRDDAERLTIGSMAKYTPRGERAARPRPARQAQDHPQCEVAAERDRRSARRDDQGRRDRRDQRAAQERAQRDRATARPRARPTSATSTPGPRSARARSRSAA